MERLTWEDYNGGCYAQDILQQDYDTATVFAGEPIDRLAAYERTNHTPEECSAAFKELAAYRDRKRMTDEEWHAYQWALTQSYLSVAAQYAKILARYIQRSKMEAQNERRSEAALKEQGG